MLTQFGAFALVLGMASPVLAISEPILQSITPSTATVNTAQTFQVSYNDSDGVANCALYVNGVSVGSMSLNGSMSGTASLPYTFTASGNHQVHVRCTDNGGYLGTSSTTTVAVAAQIVDTTSPVAPTNLVRIAPQTSSVAQVSWSGSSDNVGVVAYQVSVDGQAFVNIGNTLSYMANSLTEGNHTIAVRAQDAAGNVSAANTITLSVSRPPTVPPTSGNPFTIENMFLDAGLISTSGSRSDLEASTGYSCEFTAAAATARVHTALGNIDSFVAQKIQNYMACGTQTSRHLGAGERLGVVTSFKAAFGRLPTTREDWYDVLKIANGRFPGQTSATAEARAKTNFRTVYLRDPNMSVTGDNNAIVVMAYGLRPLPRNMGSEVAAIGTFKYVYGHLPTTTVDWDIVRAIAYSGASR